MDHAQKLHDLTGTVNSTRFFRWTAGARCCRGHAYLLDDLPAVPVTEKRRLRNVWLQMHWRGQHHEQDRNGHRALSA
ncbi:hypothetical protein [Anatilimnocola aggregata]|uniref:hypothetical protein n=1 Tax=Anatilimnocola aggregata TaxID=2528021 RepID=UPI0011A7279C|nr:hypothetical protein [Anatilimnocola aggregata]